MTFRSFSWLLGAGAALLVGVACSAPKSNGLAVTTGVSPAPIGASEFRTTATVKDIMDSIVDPSADYLWDSVATIVTRAGTEERRPRTSDDWKNVRRRARTLPAVASRASSGISAARMPVIALPNRSM